MCVNFTTDLTFLHIYFFFQPWYQHNGFHWLIYLFENICRIFFLIFRLSHKKPVCYWWKGRCSKICVYLNGHLTGEVAACEAGHVTTEEEEEETKGHGLLHFPITIGLTDLAECSRQTRCQWWLTPTGITASTHSTYGKVESRKQTTDTNPITTLLYSHTLTTHSPSR